jgi:hypothetical protein
MVRRDRSIAEQWRVTQQAEAGAEELDWQAESFGWPGEQHGMMKRSMLVKCEHKD